MLRAVLACLALTVTAAFAASDSTTLSAPLNPPLAVPSNLPKIQKNPDSLQIRGADSELDVVVPTQSDMPPSVFDDLTPENNLTQQKAQILLKRNLLDDATLTYKSNVGLRDSSPINNGGVATQTGQNQSTTELKWDASDALSFTTTNEMDQLIELQRTDPARTRNSFETRYKLPNSASLALGVSNEDFYSGNEISLEQQTAASQYQQKIGKLPLTWSGGPSYIKQADPMDYTQNREGTQINQSLLWNVNPSLTWNVGTGWTNWDYTDEIHQQVERNIFSEWTRQIRSNIKFIVRTDYQTTTDYTDSNTITRQDAFKLTIGQQLKLTDDFSAVFDFRQEYQHEINSTWAPTDHSATISLQKKF